MTLHRCDAGVCFLRQPRAKRVFLSKGAFFMAGPPRGDILAVAPRRSSDLRVTAGFRGQRSIL